MVNLTRPRLITGAAGLLVFTCLAGMFGGRSGVLWLVGVLTLVAIVAGGYVLVRGGRVVPTGHIGVIHLNYGSRHRADTFTVRVHGSPGPQAATLEADRFYWRPPPLYQVEYVPRVHVPAGTIAVVVAKAGLPPPVSSILARHVECDFFQDGRAFLLGGGQMGRQPGFLPGGASYAINHHLFEVLTVDTLGEGRRYGLTAADLREIPVPEGSTGVVIALEGAPPAEDDASVGPPVPGHMHFQLPWVFLANGGQRGAQAETLTHGGVYRINPWFVRVVLIPTRALSLNWTRKDNKPTGNFDTALDRIRINVEGYWLRFGMSQTIRIPAKAAPLLVGRFGEQETDVFGSSDAENPTPVQRFVERVLGDTVAGYFQATASEYKVLSFIASRNEVRLQLEDQVRQALAEWGVEAVRTNLSEFEPEDTNLDELRREIATERERLQRQIAAENEKHQILLEQEKNVVLEEQIRRTQLGTEREVRRLEVTHVEERVQILGREVVALESFLEKLSQMKVPGVISGDTTASPMLNMALAQQLITRTIGEMEPQKVFGARAPIEDSDGVPSPPPEPTPDPNRP